VERAQSTNRVCGKQAIPHVGVKLVAGGGVACGKAFGLCHFLPVMRVIAGRLGSRRLRAAPKGVRPTGDRVRESLFAALGDVEGARVLDLFAGTGALGIEALSRGAGYAVFVERARASLAVLRGNLADLELGATSQVLPIDAQRALALLAGRHECFDLILVDPPYDAGLGAPVLESLLRLELVAPGGSVVVERAKRNPLEPVEGWLRQRERTYGDTVLVQLRPDPAFGCPDRCEEAPR
jgi:16S rRNA (guanine966-N2)-methyltransferase